MKKIIEWGANRVVSLICMVAQMNITCASVLIGYQPRVPQSPLKGEKND